MTQKHVDHMQRVAAERQATRKQRAQQAAAARLLRAQQAQVDAERRAQQALGTEGTENRP